MASIISWFEIPVHDLNRAVQFYAAAFEYEIEVVELMGTPYGMLPRQGEVAGSLVKRDDLEPGKGVSLYFRVFDIPSTLERIEANGGKVVLGKTLLTVQESGNLVVKNSLIDGKMGYFAQFIDSEGNLMALHSNS